MAFANIFDTGVTELPNGSAKEAVEAGYRAIPAGGAVGHIDFCVGDHVESVNVYRMTAQGFWQVDGQPYIPRFWTLG